MQYLKSEQYYIDLYNLFTIKACLKVISFWQNLYKNKDTDPKLKGISPEEVERGFNHYISWDLRIKKGEEYRRKSQTISDWVERDRVRQGKVDNTPAPSDIICPDCRTEMVADDFKYLEDWPEDKPMRVMFIFRCPKCKKSLSLYENGEEHISKPTLCPKCGKEIVTKFERKGGVITTTEKCGSCKYTHVVTEDLEKQRLEREATEKKDRELLNKYRVEFCLSDNDGQEYIELMESMEVAQVVREEEMQRYDNPRYERSLQLKKTNISDLEVLLAKSLEKSKYTKLSFSKPEIGQYVIVPFTVQDNDSSRRDRTSVSELEKIIKDSL